MSTEEETRIRRRLMEASVEYEAPREVMDALEGQLTNDAVARLIAYAEQKVRRLYWQGILGGEMPEGYEPGDLVAQAVERVIDGRRKWDPEETPDLLEYLTSVIDSLTSNLVKGWANRRMRTDAALTSPKERERGRSAFDGVCDGRSDPGNELLRKEQKQEADAFLWALLEDLGDDPLLQKMVECFVDGVTKPAQIAQELKVKTKEIKAPHKNLCTNSGSGRSPRQWYRAVM